MQSSIAITDLVMGLDLVRPPISDIAMTGSWKRRPLWTHSAQRGHDADRGCWATLALYNLERKLSECGVYTGVSI